MKAASVYFLLSVVFFSQGCIISFANKNLGSVHMDSMGDYLTAVSTEVKGKALIFNLIPTGEEPDSKPAIFKLMSDNNCSDLKNIETTYYLKSYFVIGFPILAISADCVK